MPEKGNMGFSTPSGDFQQSFERLRDELRHNRANWEEVEDIIIELADMIVGVLEANPLSPDTATPADAAALFGLGAMGYIAKVGNELTRVHERLARVEKSIHDLELVLTR